MLFQEQTQKNLCLFMMIDFDFSFLERTFARECMKKFVLQKCHRGKFIFHWRKCVFILSRRWRVYMVNHGQRGSNDFGVTFKFKLFSPSLINQSVNILIDWATN